MKIFGMHIKEKNSALSSVKPHISIGWSSLGDLSSIKTKDELQELYVKTYSDATTAGVGQNVSQIGTFLFDMNKGDYVVLSDYNIVHIGKIISDYYYAVMDCQDKDYVNNRDVEWLGHYQTNVFNKNLRNTLGAARSVYVLDTKYEQEIKAIVSDELIKKTAYFNELVQRKDADIGEPDGSYNLFASVVDEYGKVDISALDYRDLEACYFSVVGTWKSTFDNKCERIKNSHLPQSSKDKLCELLDSLKSKSASMGMFGTGFQTCQSVERTASQKIVKMLVDISNETDEKKCIEIARNTLQDKYYRVNTGMASIMLHCLKPTVFPVINNAVKDIFNLLHIGIRDDIQHYADSVETIRQFRDKYLKFSHYRTLDLFAYYKNKEKEESAAENKSNVAVDGEDGEIASNYYPNIILYGPPGTGKTYSTVTKALAIIDGTEIKDKLNKDEYAELKNRYDGYVKAGRIAFTTFHQSYGYEEFIEGIKPDLDNKAGLKYDLPDGVFKAFCKVAEKDGGNKYVFIIDEINRGNVSKIFGELITLIEPSKRLGKPEEYSCVLPYSKEKFGVPQNVYILGTMNTADRSLVQLDAALRRRFEFEEMMPRYDCFYVDEIDGIKIADLLMGINNKICVLLDREHQIGHSYFMALDENSTLDDLRRIFKNRIIPLLQEYFYDDYKMIESVLCDKFVKRTLIKFRDGSREKIELCVADNAEDYIEIYDGAAESEQ